MPVSTQFIEIIASKSHCSIDQSQTSSGHLSEKFSNKTKAMDVRNKFAVFEHSHSVLVLIFLHALTMTCDLMQFKKERACSCFKS